MERLHAPVRYLGGKGGRVAQLLRLVPPGGRPYAEPYCGSAALLFARLDRTRVTGDIIAGWLLAAGLALYAIELESRKQTQ